MPDLVETTILETDVPAGLETPATRLFEAFPYTSTILYALENWLRSVDDRPAADLVHACMVDMAKHEAANL